MKARFHLFLDRRQLLFLLIEILVLANTIPTLLTEQAQRGLFWVPYGLFNLLFFGCLLIHPCLYVMTDKGIHTFYVLGFVHTFLPWNTVRKLEILRGGGRKRIPYFHDTIRIHGTAEGPRFFFADNEIIRTHRARLLLERYTGFPVEGSLTDSLRARRKRRKERAAIEKRRSQRRERLERRRAERDTQRRGKTSKNHNQT